MNADVKQPAAGGRMGTEPSPAPTPSPEEALKSVFDLFRELQAYAGHYLTAKWDGIKLSMRNLVLMAALGVVGLIAAGAMLVTAVVLVCTGLSSALNALFESTWLGQLIVGILILGGAGAGAYFGLGAFLGKSRKNTVKRYETRQRQQQYDYGHSVEQRAREGHFPQ